MGNESFDGKALSEKLSKLNNSQQSIESLSRWCISHRKKAKQIVETWEKLLNSAQKEQRISFLYLSNDILQNSRRKGSEFVNEFWKVLPAALKQVHDTGEESGKKVVTRLVDIWEGRKVFGSRGKSLKDEMLAINPPSRSVSQVKSSNPIKIVKRDAQSVRIKLTVGALPEKIIGAYESVLDEHLNEEAALEKCDIALQCLGKIEEDVEISKTQGNLLESGLQDELQEQEDVLGQSIEKLDSAEAKRISLVSLLKEALQEQESKLAHIRSQLQAARQQVEQAQNIRTGMTSALQAPSLITMATEQGRALTQPIGTQTRTLVVQQPQAISFTPLKTTEEESKKATAAAVAARLAASASSAQMLTSVLSSLVAEEAASMSSGGGAPKRQKLEKPMITFSSDAGNSESGGAPGFFAPIPGGGQANFSPPLPPPPPPPPAISQSAPTPSNQYVQQGHFGYGSNALPPLPGPMTMPMPMPPHFSIGMARPNSSQAQAQSQAQQSPQQQQLQPPNGGPFYRPPGMGFYGQSHQPTTPPVHRQ